MGFSLSWIAIKGASRESALAALGLEGTGSFEEIFESDLTGVSVPSGWYVVVANHGDPDLTNDQTLARISPGTEVVTCSLEEHVMCSSAAGWKDGRQVWSIEHSSEKGGISHLETAGDLPTCFAGIRDLAKSEQEQAGGPGAEVDHTFDVPVDVAGELTKYWHDRDIAGVPAGERAYEVLRPLVARKRSWIRRLFAG